MAVTFISYESKTERIGTILVPAACDYIVALVNGSVQPVVINGIRMTVKAQMPEREEVKAVSVQILKSPIKAVSQPYAHQATSVLFVYVYNAVCTRPDVVQNYTGTGTVSGDLATSTDDLVLGIAASNVEQVEIKGDTVAFTNVLNEPICRAGYIVPGDASLNVVGTAPDTSSEYWYQPPAVWVEGELISEGYYTEVPTYHAGYWYLDPLFGQPGHTSEYVWQPAYYTYELDWHPPVYGSGYWRYPPKVLVVTGVHGKINIAVVSIADEMIGSTHVSRPVNF